MKSGFKTHVIHVGLYCLRVSQNFLGNVFHSVFVVKAVWNLLTVLWWTLARLLLFCRWVDGSAFDFVAWLENEPSAHGGFENCGEIWHHAGNNSTIYELKNSLWLWFCSWVNGAPFYFVLWDRDEPSNHKSIGELCAAMKPKTGMLALPSMTDVL